MDVPINNLGGGGELCELCTYIIVKFMYLRVVGLHFVGVLVYDAKWMLVYQ